MPLDNPKDLVGRTKLSMSLFPNTATMLGALALADGAGKYGRNNFRATPVRASIYYDALLRHMAAWFENEELDPESGIPHLGHALACIAILVDAGAAGTLVDDRNFPGGHAPMRDVVRAMLPEVLARHADKNPVHYHSGVEHDRPD